jgi:hypothetical protein
MIDVMSLDPLSQAWLDAANDLGTDSVLAVRWG